MNLFINDIPVRIVHSDTALHKRDYNLIINAANEPITPAKLLHRVAIKHASKDDLDMIFDLLDHTTPQGLINLTVAVDNYDDMKKFLKKKFKIIKAAGGLIRKGEKVLMIYRLKKWDLPKGKLDKGENHRLAAKREVEEECNVKVDVQEKICTTWHTYTMKRRQILKKTVWYKMDIVKHDKMKPQIEEDIEEVRWMSPKEVYHALQHSYKSISFVFDAYYKKEKELRKEKQS
jgi:8-oxo-dGTP pyrophosphatase MutT (NUDIX family)